MKVLITRSPHGLAIRGERGEVFNFDAQDDNLWFTIKFSKQ